MVYKKSDKLEMEMFSWVLLAIIFVTSYVFFFIHGWLSNCVFEWPIRWDIKTCWNEQKAPATQKALNETAKFM